MSTLTSLIQNAEPLIERFNLKEVVVNELGFNDVGFSIFENEVIRLRLGSYQGEEHIDIASTIEPDNWFDITIVENFYENVPAISVYSTEELFDFAIRNRDMLQQQFLTDYSSVKFSLTNKTKERYNARFPNHPVN